MNEEFKRLKELIMECQSNIQLLDDLEYLRLVQLWEEIAVSLRYISIERNIRSQNIKE